MWPFRKYICIQTLCAISPTETRARVPILFYFFLLPPFDHSLSKEIIASLPKSTDDLFALGIDTAVLAKHNLAESKVRPWLVKNMGEVMGGVNMFLVGEIVDRVTRGESARDSKVAYDEIHDAH